MLEDRINQSVALVNWIDSKVLGLQIPSDNRHRMAAACLDMAHEHHKAIVLLCKYQIYGTSFAVLRMLFESFVRGVWLHRCATDKQVDQFLQDKVKLSMSELINEIEKLHDFKGKALSTIKSFAWNPMNSYAHSGYLQAVRRNTDESIAPNYKEEEVIQVIQLADNHGMIALMAIAQLANDEKLIREIIDKEEYREGEP